MVGTADREAVGTTNNSEPQEFAQQSRNIKSVGATFTVIYGGWYRILVLVKGAGREKLFEETLSRPGRIPHVSKLSWRASLTATYARLHPSNVQSHQ